MRGNASKHHTENTAYHSLEPGVCYRDLKLFSVGFWFLYISLCLPVSRTTGNVQGQVENVLGAIFE